MSRSGLMDASDMEDPLEYGRWRGAVRSAILGKRGQSFLKELLAALDAMPEKKLIKGELQEPTGDVCAIGCVGRARGLDMAKLDIYDYDFIAATLGINEKLVQEIEFINDEWYAKTPEDRFTKVREWVVENLKPASSESSRE